MNFLNNCHSGILKGARNSKTNSAYQNPGPINRKKHVFSLNRAESPSFYFTFFTYFSNFQTAITRDSKRSISSYRGGPVHSFSRYRSWAGSRGLKRPFFRKSYFCSEKDTFSQKVAPGDSTGVRSEWVPGFVSEWVPIKNQLIFIKIN